MAVISEPKFVRTCQSILMLVEIMITHLRENWFAVQEGLVADIHTLRSKLEVIKSDTVCSDSALAKLLKREEILQKILLQTETLERNLEINAWCTLGSLLYARTLDKMCGSEFLQRTLQSSLQDVTFVLENFEDDEWIRDLHDISARTSKSAFRRPIIDNDGPYVPILVTQTAVINAIENFNGPPTVLLYGGVGTGKSTLARYLSWRYDREENNIFDLVSFVACGHLSSSDVPQKQFDILKDVCQDCSVDLPPRDGFSRARIANAFRALLSEKKTLIILDNVTDSGFTSKMFEAAKGTTYAKWLVTSQMSTLCDFARPELVSIQMASPNIYEARKILASLSGCVDEIIPNHLQETADKMIEATEGNSLALACVASALGGTVELREWQGAYSQLSDFLDKPHQVVNKTSSRSMFAAVKIGLETVTPDAKVLLFLIYACKGKSVPEDVLRLMYPATSLQTFNSSINDLAIRQLIRSRPNTPALGEDQTDEHLEQEDRAWSCPSVIKLYIVNACQKEARSRLEAFFEGLSHGVGPERTVNFVLDFKSDRARLTIALCAFYFDRAHADKFVAGVATGAGNALNSNHGITDLRGKATAPIIWLLDGKESYALPTRKVFLKYAYEGQLDYDSIASLLHINDIAYLLDIGNIAYLLDDDDIADLLGGLPSGPSARLSILRSTTEIFIREPTSETTPLLDQNSRPLLKALVNLMDSKKASQRQALRQLSTLESRSAVERSIQEAASKALLSISWKAAEEKSTFIVASTPDVVTVLVNTIKDHVASPRGQPHRSDLLAENAAGTLRNLSFGDLASGERKSGILNQIWNVDGAHKALRDSLFKSDQPVLQENAARVLACLCKEISEGRETIKLEILKWKDAFEILVGIADLGDDQILPKSSITQPSEIVEVESEDSKVLGLALRKLSTDSKLLDPSYERRREAFEPIRLSLRDEPDLKQAYLKYVSEGLLDLNNITKILAASRETLKTFKSQNSSCLSVALKILKAIENVCRMQSKTPLLTKSNPERLLLVVLVRIMSSNDPHEKILQEAASRALLCISKKAIEEKKSAFLATEDILGALVTSIQDSCRSGRSNTLGANAASTLRELGYRLTYKQNETNNHPTISSPGEIIGQV